MGTYAPIGQATFYSTPYTYSPLLSDGDDVVSRSASMASGGGVVKRGAILSWAPATGLLTQPVATTDCNCILANDIDATSAAAAAIIYVGGKFKADAVIWPGALGHALVTESLRMHDIQIESVVFTDGTLVKSAPKDVEGQAAQQVVELNKAEEGKAAADIGKAAEEKVTVDSPWAYLTAEEREKNPEFAEVPTTQELGEAAGQIPDVPPVTINPTSATVLAAGGTGSITVTVTGPGTSGTWTVDKDSTATWLTYTPTTPQSASGSLNWTAAANTGAARSAHFYINGKTFTLNQGAGVSR
jgi:hypothetical protein